MASPLIAIPGPAAGETVWTVLGAHGSEVLTFLFTFSKQSGTLRHPSS